MSLLSSQEESVAAETEALEKRLADLSIDVTREVRANQYQETRQCIYFAVVIVAINETLFEPIE